MNPDHVRETTRVVNESGQARTEKGEPTFPCECSSLSCERTLDLSDFIAARKTLGHSRSTEGCLFIVHQDCENWARLDHDIVLKFGTVMAVCERRFHSQILISD